MLKNQSIALGSDVLEQSGLVFPGSALLHAQGEKASDPTTSRFAEPNYVPRGTWPFDPGYVADCGFFTTRSTPDARSVCSEVPSCAPVAHDSLSRFKDHACLASELPLPN
jgi:hypothetical protein